MGLPFQRAWRLIYGNFKLLLAQTIHINVKQAEKAVTLPLEDSSSFHLFPKG